VIPIKLSILSKKIEVAEFLEKLKNILQNEDFNIDTDFTLITAKKKNGKEEYSETLIDKDDINDREIYIKLKIKERQESHVLCVSFHYAEAKMIFPYA